MAPVDVVPSGNVSLPFAPRLTVLAPLTKDDTPVAVTYPNDVTSVAVRYPTSFVK